MSEYCRRVELPSRRLGWTVQVDWKGLPWQISVGLDQDGIAREIFIETHNPGIAAAIWHDLAIVTSHLLQRGMRAAELRPHLSDRPPSLLAVAITAAEEIEREFGVHARALYAERGEG